MRLDLLQAMNIERAARRAAVVVTDLAGDDQRLVRAAEVAADPLAEALEAALRSGKSTTIEADGRSYFLTVQVPPIRLVAIGAVHISQALAPMARLTDFDMVIVDPRTAFATAARFPDVRLIAEWPEVALPPLRLDRYTALCVLTHDPKIDDPGLVEALRAECFYIGALGSRKSHGNRLARLTKQGFGAEALSRIHAPIGLDIGSVSPSEIAVSIIGEIIAALRKKPPRAETMARAEKVA
ncbi:MAG TPA: XdhC family protein [Beijerinckiaceae bacterium]|jgi:xanthine dehydrogenase accessory factor|nr:XdhC family protein [Beijerinckiaceae bacterium]